MPHDGAPDARAGAADNPYAPPSSPLAGEPRTGVAPYTRMAAFSLVLAACLGGFLGVVQTVQFGWGLRRFGGLEYVPRLIGLSTVRALGSGAALLVVVVSAALVMHRAGRRARDPVVVARDWRALWLCAGTIAAFAVVCICTMLAAAATAAVFFGVRASTFFTQGVASILAVDVERGVVLAAVDGVLTTTLVPLAASFLAAPKRSLALKLFVAYVAVQATTIAEQAVLAALG
jgi:ABC-type transporter Mla maintaining outer membrane lipid asymmetry permease subunit MlaE